MLMRASRGNKLIFYMLLTLLPLSCGVSPSGCMSDRHVRVLRRNG